MTAAHVRMGLERTIGLPSGAFAELYDMYGNRLASESAIKTRDLIIVFTEPSLEALAHLFTPWQHVSWLFTPREPWCDLQDAMSMAWVPNTSFIVIAGCRLNYQPHLTIIDAESPVTRVVLSVGPNQMLDCNGECKWNHELCQNLGEPMKVAVTEDGKQLAVVQASGQVQLYNMEETTYVEPSRSSGGGAHFGPPGTKLDGRTLACPPTLIDPQHTHQLPQLRMDKGGAAIRSVTCIQHILLIGVHSPGGAAVAARSSS